MAKRHFVEKLGTVGLLIRLDERGASHDPAPWAFREGAAPPGLRHTPSRAGHFDELDTEDDDIDLDKTEEITDELGLASPSHHQKGPPPSIYSQLRTPLLPSQSVVITRVTYRLMSVVSVVTMVLLDSRQTSKGYTSPIWHHAMALKYEGVSSTLTSRLRRGLETHLDWEISYFCFCRLTNS